MRIGRYSVYWKTLDAQERACLVVVSCLVFSCLFAINQFANWGLLVIVTCFSLSVLARLTVNLIYSPVPAYVLLAGVAIQALSHLCCVILPILFISAVYVLVLGFDETPVLLVGHMTLLMVSLTLGRHIEVTSDLFVKTRHGQPAWRGIHRRGYWT